MSSPPISFRTFVLQLSDNRSVAFDNVAGGWRFQDGSLKTFSDLQAKKPELCTELVRKMLAADRNFVCTTDWKFGSTLNEMKMHVNRSIEELGYRGELVKWRRAKHQPNRGVYPGVPPTAEPMWLARLHVVDIEFPPLRAFATLVQHVQSGHGVRSALLPGDGAEQVHELLSALPDCRVIRIDLGQLRTAEDVQSHIAAHAPAGIDVLRESSGVAAARTITRAIAPPPTRLILLVSGFGAHLARSNPASLQRVARALDAFKTDGASSRAPVVTVVSFVLMSVVNVFHVFRDLRATPGRGSFSFLNELEHVSIQPPDRELVEEWMRTRMQPLDAKDLQSLIERTQRRVRAAMDLSALQGDASHAARLAVVDNAHARAGIQIFYDLPPCCLRHLIHGSQDDECARVLREAEILREDLGEIAIPQWAQEWPRGRG